MKHIVPFYPIICQTQKEDFFKIGKTVAGGKIISVKNKGFLEVVNEIKDEIVHAHGRGFPFPEACSIFARKSIYSPHNDTIGSSLLTKTFRRFMFNRYDKIVVQTSYGKRKLTKEGINKKKIVVIPNPVDYKFFSKTKNGGSFRKKHEVGKREKIAISVGIRPLKNPDIISEACKKAGIRVVLVGPASKKEVESQWEGKGFDWYMPPKNISDDENVILTGQLNSKELLQAFDAASIFINSSNYENFGLAVYEAASAGLALCLPRQGTFDSFKKCALFHHHKNSNELSGNISVYLNKTNLRKRNGSEARKIAKKADYEIIKKMFEKFYKETI